MESVGCLVERHLAIRKLDKEIDNIRCDLIDRYMRNNGESNDFDASKKNYYELSEHVEKEKRQFEEILTNIPVKEETESHYEDTVDNIDYIDESSVSNNALYASSVDTVSVYNPVHLHMEETHEKKEQSVDILMEDPVHEEKEEVLVSEASIEITDDVSSQVSQVSHAKDEEEYPSLGGSASTHGSASSAWRDRPLGQIAQYRRGTIKARAGYRYTGKGFEVFTGKRNKCQPIYSRTLLYCNATCGRNKEDLIDYLVKFGKFRKEMIKQVAFKPRRGSYSQFYALVTVRAPVKVIKHKIRTLNKAVSKKVMHIFERNVSRVAASKRHNVLCVNNFDIERKDAHREFTDLFVKYGELVKDIIMGIDKNRDLFAIVHFRDVADAQRCIESRECIRFGGKILNVSYSKF